MKQFAIGFFCVCFLAMHGYSQQRLEGLFEGTLTIGGLDGAASQRLEMYLKIDRRQISGRSYVHLAGNKTIEMELRGVFYQDFSIYLEEVAPVDGVEDAKQAPFTRKYQLMYSGSFDEVLLTGFWQQASDSPLDDKRQIGRIKLKKVRNNKA